MIAMRICVVGGIFDKGDAYRDIVSTTPETTLVEGLRSRGHSVTTLGHRDFVASDQFDLIHVHHLGRGAVRAACGRHSAPLVFTRHGWAGRPVTREAAARFVVRRSDAVIALSETEARMLRARWLVPPSRVRVIPNGIDADQFAYVAPPPAGPPWRLLFVGQLIREKGVYELIQAVALLGSDAPIELRFVHHVDTELEEVRAQANALDLGDVRFLGRMPPHEVAREYARCHAFVLPSYAEALPSTVSEALMVGRPIIATDVAALGRQIGDFGVVVQPRDPVALAGGIRSVLERYTGLATRAAEESDSAVRRCAVSAMVESHEELYNEILDGRVRRHRPTVSLGTKLGRVLLTRL